MKVEKKKECFLFLFKQLHEQQTRLKRAQKSQIGKSLMTKTSPNYIAQIKWDLVSVAGLKAQRNDGIGPFY